MSASDSSGNNLQGVAIIGMAGRFPGAANVSEFWRNQLSGVEAISHFRVEELEVANAGSVTKHDNYVRARSVLANADLFDAEFFGIYPREAELMDPQQRLFLECCWEAFEDAGYDPFAYPGSVGVHAGGSMPTYFLSRLCADPAFAQRFTGEYQVGNYQEMLGNSLDFLATRVSYKLNLRGPSFTLQAGCSTSLVAVCQACQSLLTYQSDMALAGGSSITFPQKRGSFYQEGGMTSPDGHCRTFDADARGTVFGSGVAVVLLKRLDEALKDGDQIYAVVRGFGVNNDGSSKIGYTAPSVEGQSRVITMAQQVADVSAESIGYIEAHGTGTPLGDPIELAALTQAFRHQTAAKQFCVIGTAKTNVGHLDVAAGVTGLINATNIVRNGIFPPTLHFKKANERFDLENSPFRVVAEQSQWKNWNGPRRAGVSAFGVGGTNAHVILEEAPRRDVSAPARSVQLLPVSARSPEALDNATRNLAEHLKSHPESNLADVAWTLQAGRKHFTRRQFVVARDVAQAIERLSRQESRGDKKATAKGGENPAVHFLFPGQGSQQANMGREVYETEPAYRQAFDRCAEILAPEIGEDLRALLYPAAGVSGETGERLTNTIVAQPAIFAVEYALAQVWMTWGIQPESMIGHSVGEFVAACLAGVFSLEDALAVVAARGKLMQSLPAGGMLSVRLPEVELRQRLNGTLSLAAVNSPSLCVVAGAFEPLEALEQTLTREGVPCRRLNTSHAFHSAMMDPILEEFAERVRQAELQAPRIPYVSGVTGTWITERDATDPVYWARHVRQPVLFSAGLTELQRAAKGPLLEVGPGSVLATLARQHADRTDERNIVSSLANGAADDGEAASLKSALGSLWVAGVSPNWEAIHEGEQRYRISLPTYPFERKRYWIEVPETTPRESVSSAAPDKQGTPRGSFAEEENPVNENTKAVVEPIPAASAANRIGRIQTAVADIFEDLSGTPIAGADEATTFLEMGFDSLFLTQVTQALQTKFSVRVAFRQLLGEQSTLKALAEYLDGKLPADAFGDPVPVVAASPDPAVAPVASADQSKARVTESSGALSTPNENGPGETAVERLLHEQLQAMNQLFSQQLDVLRGMPRATSIQPASADPQLEAPLSAEGAKAESSSNTAPTTNVKANLEKEEFKPFGPYKPPQKGLSNDLTEQQRLHLASLIGQYTKRSSRSKAMTQEHRATLADPRVVSGFRSMWKEMIYPIITTRSKGSRLWDVDGNEYIDILNGFGPIMLGHRPEFVEQAIAEQLREGFEIGPQTPLAGEIAQMFCEMTGNERMTFCNTGSEAVIAAMRVARTVTGRSKVVLFAGAYHGMFDEVLVKGVKKGGEPHSLPIAPGIPRESVANMVVLDYGTPESLEYIRKHANELAAVLVEPVQSRHPNLQPREFLHEIRNITQKAGAALIFDEVVTGFRVHPGGCQALFGIRADLATYGKVLAGGMPIGVLAGKAEFMDALDGGSWQFGDDSSPSVGVTFFAGTFVRHPLTLAAVKAVLKHFLEEGPKLQEQLSARTASMVRTLNDLLEANQVPAKIETFGSIFYFSFPSDQPLASLLYYHLRAKGVYLLEGFPCFLTTAHSDADVEKIVQAFRESIVEMQAGGIFPEPRQQADGVVSTQVRQQTAIAATGSHNGGDEAREVPLTEAQLEIWLSAQLGDEASCAYNESLTLHMRGPLNQEALRASLRDLVNRHEALRGTIVPERNALRIADEMEAQLSVQDLSDESAQKRQSALEAAKKQEAETPFDLLHGPLLRLRLLRMALDDHALIVTSHHIVCDGWSTNILLDELSRLYTAKSAGATVALSEPVKFSSYTQQQAELGASAQAASTSEYWLRQFEKLVQPLELPTDRARPPVKSFRGSTFRTHIDAATSQQIRQAGAKQKCTLFVTLLAGFAALLHRLTQQDEVVIGVPTAGQSLLDDGTLVGHCVNFLPIRLGLPGQQSAVQLLQEVRQRLLDAYDNQNYTYGTLVRKLKLRRDPSRLPLVEVQFNLEKVGTGLQFDGLRVEAEPNPKAAVNFDLFLNVVESGSGLMLDCDYNSDLFDRETVERWMSHYVTLLTGMAARTTEAVDHLPLLSAAERQRMLVEWNATVAEYPSNARVHELFEEQAARTPNAIAVLFQDKTLTYQELDRRSNQLANHLRKIGVGPGMLIGISIERSLEMMVGLLGIWKAGAAYVPLDPAYPRERLTFILDETAVPFLVTESKLVTTLPVFDTRLVCLDRDWVLIATEPVTKPETSGRSDDVAYTIYTSGSTGKPKGVEVSHRNVVNLLCSMRSEPGLRPKDRLMAVTTLSFDIAGLEFFLPLITGATVILSDRETASDGRLLLKLMEQRGATVMQATPATWRMLLEAGWKGASSFGIWCGGEAWSQELAKQLTARGQVWNMYGPTETTIWSATSRVTPDAESVTFGPPIRNTQFYVLDPQHEPVPVGVPGELYIGGDGVALGYCKRPQLTAERFVPDPFSEKPGAKLYRTGDLVRYRKDGRLEFLGRLDTQVKVRGFRIELGEIEAALLKHAEIREAAVVAQEDGPDSKKLVAYLVGSGSSQPTADELRSLVGQSVPDYMVPSIFAFIPELPRTPNGKVDRKSLVALDLGAGGRNEKPFVAARTPTEEHLSRIAAEVLHLERVSVEDSLFDLGADSVHLFQIIARAARVDLTVTPQQLLRFRTIAGVARDLENGGGSARTTSGLTASIQRLARDQYRLDHVAPTA